MKANRSLVVLSFILAGMWTCACELEHARDSEQGYFDVNSGAWKDGFDERHCGRDKINNNLVDCFAISKYANAKENAVKCVFDTEWRCQIDSTQTHPCKCGYQYDNKNDECVRVDKEYISEESTDINDPICKEYDKTHCGIKEEYKALDLSYLNENGVDAYINCKTDYLNATELNCINIAAPEHDYQCNALACVPGYHLAPAADAEIQKCVEDTVEACGSLDNNCTTKGGVLPDHILCVDGRCKADACDDKYYLDAADSMCKPQTVENCGVEGNIDCKKQYSDATESSLFCENGACVVKCSDGKIQSETGECFTQSWTACGPTKHNCSVDYKEAEPSKNKAECVNGECRINCSADEVQTKLGKCISKVCPDGYRWVETGDTGEGDCVPNNSIEHCGVAAGTDQGVDCRSVEGYEFALCIHPTDSLNDLMFDLKCEYKSAQQVVEEFKSESEQYDEFICSALTCKSGFTLKDNMTKVDGKNQGYYNCESYRINSCGSNKVDCTLEPFWDEGLCYVDEDGKGNCIATSCKAGGYLDVIKCRPNTAASCGTANHACKTNQYCGIEDEKAACLDACPDGMSSENRVCVDFNSSIQYCGEFAKASCIANHRERNESVRTCVNGICELTSCLNGYHRCKDDDSENPCECSGPKDATGYCCEMNTKQRCGIDRVKCSASGSGIGGGVAIASLHCSSGTDDAKCVTGEQQTIGLEVGMSCHTVVEPGPGIGGGTFPKP